MNGSTKGGKESAARSANLGGCKGRAANEDRRQTKRRRRESSSFERPDEDQCRPSRFRSSERRPERQKDHEGLPLEPRKGCL